MHNPPRILIVDDHETNRDILATRLGMHGYELLQAADGEEALASAREHLPDLILLDVMMPKVDGIEVCRRLKGDTTLPFMPIILVTAKADSKDVVAGLEAGADDYIVKPFDPDELRARVNVGLRVLGLQEKLADRVSELEQALSRVKRLQGLLPICSYCKRIRGDDRYWQQVDSYITEHTDAQFTHGICPPCSDRLLSEIETQRGRQV
jgi:DNA-binding response OmpR family regulator